MAVSLNDLKAVMRIFISQLSPAFEKARDVPTNRPHATLLPTGGVGTATAPRIYKAAVRFTLDQGGMPVKAWPSNWKSLSIDQLAPKLL